MKTLKDLTPEIRSKIPQYLDRARNFYNGDLPFNRAISKKYIEYIYELAGQKKPLVIFADNPNQYKIYWSILKRNKIIPFLFALKNKQKNLDSELYFELGSKLDSELDSELGSELYSELRSELDSELYSELHSKLDSEIYS